MLNSITLGLLFSFWRASFWNVIALCFIIFLEYANHLFGVYTVQYEGEEVPIQILLAADVLELISGVVIGSIIIGSISLIKKRRRKKKQLQQLIQSIGSDME
ncbi:MAG: hypothetical protein AAF399_17055 [Bacteroidota bacterium]